MVMLSAPDWQSERDASISFVPAENECTIDPTECHDTQAPADPSNFEHGEDDDQLSGDHLSFTYRVSIPDHESETSVEGPSAFGHVSGSNTTADDAYVWHNTFIEQRYVNAPQPPGCPDYWLGGDNRGFASGPGAATHKYDACSSRLGRAACLLLQERVAYNSIHPELEWHFHL
jgi:hypothetical protein